MKQLIIELAKEIDIELKTLLTDEEMNIEDKISKIKEKYPQVYQSLENFNLRNDETDMRNTLDFVNDTINSQDLFKIKEEAKIIYDKLNSFKPEKYFKDYINNPNANPNLVLECLNLFNNNKDKIKLGKLYKIMKKEKDLDFRRSRTTFYKSISDAFFEDALERVFGIYNPDEFIVKFLEFLDSTELSYKEKDNIISVYNILLGFILNLKLKSPDSFNELNKMDIEYYDLEFIKSDSLNNMAIFVAICYNIRNINNLSFQ